MDCTQPAICLIWKVLKGVFIACLHCTCPYNYKCIIYPSCIILWHYSSHYAHVFCWHWLYAFIARGPTDPTAVCVKIIVIAKKVPVWNVFSFSSDITKTQYVKSIELLALPFATNLHAHLIKVAKYRNDHKALLLYQVLYAIWTMHEWILSWGVSVVNLPSLIEMGWTK